MIHTRYPMPSPGPTSPVGLDHPGLASARIHLGQFGKELPCSQQSSIHTAPLTPPPRSLCFLALLVFGVKPRLYPRSQNPVAGVPMSLPTDLNKVCLTILTNVSNNFFFFTFFHNLHLNPSPFHFLTYREFGIELPNYPAMPLLGI